MFDNLIKVFVNLAVNPRIIHSLPGRLRLHIPALPKIPEKWRVSEEAISELIKSIPDIKSVSLSYVTGNILIQYEQEILSEKEIIQGIQKLAAELVKKRGKLNQISPEGMPIYIKRLKKVLNEKRIRSITEVSIHEDVWS